MSEGNPYVSPDAFTIHRHGIRVRSNEVFTLIPFGCVHRHSPAHSSDHWQRFLEDCKREMTRGRQVLFLGMGDYDDLASASERETFAKLNHESTQQSLDDFAEKKEQALCGELAFMRGHLIGLVEGNHFWRHQDGTTSTQRMCRILKCPYLGTTTIIQISMDGGGSRTTLTILAFHGAASGGRTAGASINSVEVLREVFPGCDIYLAGHDHRRWAVPLTVLHLCGNADKLTIKDRQQWLGRTGSFLRAYMPGEPGYISKRGKAPMDLGAIMFDIKAGRKEIATMARSGRHVEERFVEIHARI